MKIQEPRPKQSSMSSLLNSENPNTRIFETRAPSKSLETGTSSKLGHHFAGMPLHAGAGDYLAGNEGTSSPLPFALRKSLEDRFQTSLETVRIHETPEDGKRVRAQRANAFTVGEHIYFANNRYRPDTSKGKQLLAHEVTHVLQQRTNRSSSNISAAENEADTIASHFSSGGSLAAVHQHVSSTQAPFFDAASLKTAIEDELDDVFVGIDNIWPQIEAEPEAERKKVREDKVLERSIRREVDPMDLLKTYLRLFFQTEGLFPVHFKSFLEATDIMGTHEARIYTILRGSSPVERTEMQQMPGFVEVIEDEMSGKELQLAWTLLYTGVEKEGSGLTKARTSVHLERGERYELDIYSKGSFEDVQYNLTQATEEEGSMPILQDTSLWSIFADQFNIEEVWYLRMIARYAGEKHFPKITGPKAPAESFVFVIWKAVEGAGTDEEKLTDTLAAVKAANSITTSGPWGLKATAKDEVLDEPWFVPMLEDELSGKELTQALSAISAPGSTVAGIRDDLEKAINKHDMGKIRTMLKDPKLSAVDLRRLQTDPVILDEMGEELTGAQLCETALLLKYGSNPFPADVTSLLKEFQKDPVNVAGAVTFLKSLAATPAKLSSLRSEPGVYFMLTNSGLEGKDLVEVLAAIRADDPRYQTAQAKGTHRTSTESVQSRLPVHFAGTEVRIPVRCNIDVSKMKGEAKERKVKSGTIEDWVRVIDEVWNGKFELENAGNKYNLVFVPYMAVGLPAADVTIFVMNWKGRSYVTAKWDNAAKLWLEREMHLYLDDLEATTVAHEFGHLLGSPDEYALTESEYKRIAGKAGKTPAPRAGETVEGLMGSHRKSTEVEIRHAEPALDVINSARDPAKFPAPFVLLKK